MRREMGGDRHPNQFLPVVIQRKGLSTACCFPLRFSFPVVALLENGIAIVNVTLPDLICLCLVPLCSTLFLFFSLDL